MRFTWHAFHTSCITHAVHRTWKTHKPRPGAQMTIFIYHCTGFIWSLVCLLITLLILQIALLILQITLYTHFTNNTTHFTNNTTHFRNRLRFFTKAHTNIYKCPYCVYMSPTEIRAHVSVKSYCWRIAQSRAPLFCHTPDVILHPLDPSGLSRGLGSTCHSCLFFFELPMYCTHFLYVCLCEKK